ncbi:MAG: Sua5/YciO/YrdC/YwlC family protein [Burkholderiaceae bacterium]|nr:Sua5/YciO/YrdC/YwlC family protein [Rhodoferax sp.]MCB2005427.1 Sua5/YciO/YrdC/YwlC family protein [Rhodoferax sp.]MCB2029304.1 Sua5/YciO/YrdC/YwlC family protein [Rhodoferax sp.]MCP5264100.1 Sua5/YciO/YrdC/YwlC family protein [Rhodoferax sp.]
MTVLNLRADAEQAMDVMAGGGIAILPNDVGYSLIAAHRPALRRIFETKKRAPSKLNAMLGDDALHRELHVVSARGRAIVQAITQDYDLPLGLIAPCRTDHPLLRALDADTFERSTKGDTLLMLLNAGPFHREITRLSLERQTLLFGSSANLSMHGTKFRVEDMEPEITAIADLVVDYGLMKYHTWKASSTLLNCETLEVVRHGSCFENIADIVQRHFGVTLTPRPVH